MEIQENYMEKIIFLKKKPSPQGFCREQNYVCGIKTNTRCTL